MFFRFITQYYLKYFLIVFLALELFFVGIDTLKYVDDLPDSANLFILFLFYDSVYAMSYTLPISLVLSSIMFFITFLKSNQLTALLALGFSRFSILKPILLVATLVTCLHIGLNCTPFAYAQESAESIINNQAVLNVRQDVLLKFNDKYIFMGKIFPLENGGARAENIKIFELENRELRSYYTAKSAFFTNDSWRLENAVFLDINKNLQLGKPALKREELTHLEVLNGFRPKVLDTFSQDKPTVSIVDAIDTLKISLQQGTSSTKMRAILYGLMIVPFFVPLSILIIASFIPSLARYGNLALISFACIVGALIVWGLFFSFSELSISGLLQPEAGVLSPFLLLFFVSLYFLRKINTKFI
ncbi:LptF/LptG family permease [Helicobacter himalayensis]|uniref:LptF/LptG family permease n=1 Tax=Helicobacter himalayensis TaxID=1591088 RepID=UPI0008322F9D|nr:LptF/LptG family permease [Helicobacter himalayensis]